MIRGRGIGSDFLSRHSSRRWKKLSRAASEPRSKMPLVTTRLAYQVEQASDGNFPSL